MIRSPLIAVPALLTFFLASSASALVLPSEECAENVDCEQGYTCEKTALTTPCNPDTDATCATDVIVEETGYCALTPVTCAADSDCGEYESCQSETGGCWAASDGTSGCSEPDPNAPAYCGLADVACTSNTDCPREFECVVVDDLCDCPEEDTNCSAQCGESDQRACQPKIIDCTTSAECPTDWSCSGGLVESCSGGGSSDGSGATEPAPIAPDEPEPDADPIPTECTTETIVGQCYPNAWGVTVAVDSSGEAGGGEAGGVEEGDPKGSDGDTNADADDDASSDAGGCSVSRAPSSGGAPFWLSLLLLVPLARRRRVAVAQKV